VAFLLLVNDFIVPEVHSKFFGTGCCSGKLCRIRLTLELASFLMDLVSLAVYWVWSRLESSFCL